MDNDKRHYTSIDLPTLEKVASSATQNEILKTLYAETNSNYRNLADIRFKLLGFVPAVSILAWIGLLDTTNPNSLTDSTMGLAVSLLGIWITYGIHIYDKRNDELYNDLVSRGRKIEEELGVHTGIFKGRLEASHRDKIFNRIINHDRGLLLIYSSVFMGWLLLILWYSIIFLMNFSGKFF